VRYFVIGEDGQKYGPADVATLNGWIAEQRLTPTQQLEEEASGVRMAASAVQGLNFPVQAAQNPYAGGQPYQSNYVRPGAVYGDDGSKDVTNAWLYVVAGFLCCVLFQIGAIQSANKAQAKGNPNAAAPKIVAIVLLCLQGIGTVIYAIAIAVSASGGLKH